MRFLDQFELFTDVIFVVMTVAYLYQFFYIIYSIFKYKVPVMPEAKKLHRYAVFISARNERNVIGELLDSLTNQDYPRDKYDIYVTADNCTDDTAQVARDHGAYAFERFNDEKKGKGYALNEMYHQVIALKGQGYYEAVVVFDADNIVDAQFLREMNKTFDTGKYDALTTYRNSKNFGQNWLTAAYSLWFMHEARHLNYARMMLGAQCMISGTGFVVSTKLMDINEGWPYYLLTEDIQFSVASTLQGFHIGYCDTAILYDEQPATWKQAWRQRLRWAKGFYQIDGRYLGPLASGVVKGKNRRLAFYDILMTALPSSLLTVALIILALWVLVSSSVMPYYVAIVFQNEMLWYLIKLIGGSWIGLTLMAFVTTVQEWKRIPATKVEKLGACLLFPVYLLSYIPISIVAIFKKVEWTPIQHFSTEELQKKNK